jgi:endonuclease YncB( thermonuclease family)
LSPLDSETDKIRLLHIGAPESGQAFGTRAKQALSERVFG